MFVAVCSFAQNATKHQYVDLGLSVKWATCNIGATKPEERGEFFSWGETWRIPTKAQIDELLENCTWEWTTLNEVNGYKVTSKKPGYTDRSIFLPVTGKYEDGKVFNYRLHGYYWSRNCGTITSEIAYTLEVYIKGASVEMQPRCESMAVRPVCK